VGQQVSDAGRGTTANDPEADAVAARLKDAREFLNLSQQFVAEQTGLPRSAISDIERGARRVDMLELKRLAAVYRLPVSHFYGDDKADADDPDPTAAALARATKQMGESEKQQLLRFAQFLQRYDGDTGAET
jgi:transcriptional regulator with XRE-family HTH domain